jgi:predicted phosphodiesterase
MARPRSSSPSSAADAVRTVRIAVLSDIHGNTVALDACLDDLRARGGAEVIVAAGDLCMDGPKPNGVLKRLEAHGVHCVRGNTDRMIGEGVPPDSEDAAAVAWVRAQIGPRRTAWLADLPHSLTFGGSDGLLVCHANPRTDDDHIWPDAYDDTLEHFFGGIEQRAIAFGHLHLPYVRLWRGKLLVNVASAGLPKDGDARAHYVIFTQRSGGWEVQPRRVAFDIAKVERQLKRSGIPQLDERLATLRRHRYGKLGEPGTVIP